MPATTLEELSKEVSGNTENVEALHSAFEKRGYNSRGVRDVFGRTFALPVDEEHKATAFGIDILIRGPSQPHMRAFWAATFGFFSCFFSVFAPAALMPYMARPRAEGGIDLSRADITDAGAAAVASTILMRIISGPLCDMFGARLTFIFLLLLAVPGIIFLMFIEQGWQLILARLLIGLGLASFVTCQVWCSQMFNKSIVGVANATAGGWGNLGGGVTQLVMPFVMLAILGATGNNVNLSWRLCFIVPLVMHILSAAFILTGRDLPDGNFKQLEQQGSKQKTSGALVAKIGMSNVNAWILFVTYGLCFGVELCMNNKVVPYFYRYYGLNPQLSGVLGSCFGLMNLFARSWGGLLSDACNKRFGMRGRLWSMWIIQTLEGLMCIILGIITNEMPNPDDYSNEMVVGTMAITEFRQTTTYSFNTTLGMVPKCGSKQIPTPDFGWINFNSSSPTMAYVRVDTDFIMIKDPWEACIHNSAPLGLTMLVMILFSVFVQMAEGLHFGIVPYVSRPALGVVSGMVGAGGNLGGFISSRNIVSAALPLDSGFINLGIIIMTLSLIMHFIYFPESGCMLLPKGALGSYDPQIIKPPADLRGADQLKYVDSTKKTDDTSDAK